MEIIESTPADQRDIYEVVRETWLATYPNADLGITKDDIAASFLEKGSDKYEEVMKKRESNATVSSNQHTWIAKDNGKVVGICFVVKRDDINEIRSIYILPEYQGRGIGKQLMEKAFEWVDHNKDLVLGVTNYNTQAVEFYKKLGFRETGRKWYTEAAKLPSGKELPSVEMVKSWS